MKAVKIFFFWFLIAVIVDAPLLLVSEILKLPSSLNGLFALFAIILATIITKRKLKKGFFG
jgi:hypothetical protein